MNSKTLANFHRFGKVCRIGTVILLALALLVTVISLTAAIYVSALPKDALTVRVTDHAEFRINEKSFTSLWGILADDFSYAGEASPKEMLRSDGSTVLPPENQDIQTSLSFFNQSYSSAKIHSDGNTKVIEADSAPAEYRSTNLVFVMVSLTLLTASIAAALFMLKRLFDVLAKSDTPFCDELVKRMKAFGVALLPAALFSTIGETLSTAFLSAGRENALQIQWGVLIAFAVTMCLVTVFRYGVQLQKESDETL